MDLRSMLNANDGGDAARKQPQAASPPQPQPPAPNAAPTATPVTPIQPAPPQGLRDYGQSVQASPARMGPGGQEYPPSHVAGGPYASPTSYHPPPGGLQTGGGMYGGGRPPAPPPLQPPSGDPRSPGSATMSGPSPYRQTPTSALSSSSGGPPFPPSQGGPDSPMQRHQYPPTPHGQPSHAPGGQYHAHRDSYAQSPVVTSVPPQYQGGAPPPGPYMQGPPPPQTPPIGPPVATPGGQMPSYAVQQHQRSHSTHSASPQTPSQAHQSTPGFGPGGSPAAASHMPPEQLARHPSQPPTPLGPPLSTGGPRPSAPGGFTQPQSPYQQRMPSVGAPVQGMPQQSPPPPRAPALPQRAPGSSAAYEGHNIADPHIRSLSMADRDRSVSVSPKTRISSLPSSAGGHSGLAPNLDGDARFPHQSTAISGASAASRGTTPAKRKMDDRDLRSDELDRPEPHRQPPGESVNGSHPGHAQPSRTASAAASPVVARRKKPRYAMQPIWAQSARGRQMHTPNFVMPKHGAHQVNGKHHDGPTRADRTMSRHASPEATRAAAAAAAAHVTAPVEPPGLAEACSTIGPWEPTILNKRPYEEVSRSIADFIYIHGINNPDLPQIQRHGAHLEIEAKLGYLINKNTTERVQLPIATECLLQDTGKIAFKSTMTEAQHKGLNEFLNSMVFETDPRNPNRVGPRVQIRYEHRHEVDKYYEMPASMQGRLPMFMQALIPQKRHSFKVRVTHDQGTGRILAKIVKARVADLDLHMPTCPLDCRISVNVEMPWEDDPSELAHMAGRTGSQGLQSPDRVKDRLSYTQGPYQLDLTQVTTETIGATSKTEKEHELEIELSSEAVLDQGRRLHCGETHHYQELIDGLVDNIRVLARKTRDFTPAG